MNHSSLLRTAKAFGVHVATEAVCQGHSAPVEFLSSWVYSRPSLSLVHGPRGGGKSYLRALATHLTSIQHDWHATHILGGSLAQSAQIYNALREFYQYDPNGDLIESFTKTSARYTTGSEVSILAASSTSVRGPHVPTLCLDEVDEIETDIRESAFGMCMAKGGVNASIAMTSTWHNIAGPMADLISRGHAGDFPIWSFCIFEVLERCPDERSGANLEKCPDCPLVKWCHEGNGKLPKAKRSNGHYSIDALIQKVRGVSLRVFEADYLCLEPRADGIWFSHFDRLAHVSEDAEYDPDLDVTLAVDNGVWTGGVFFQERALPDGTKAVTVFADYLAEGRTVEQDTIELKGIAEKRCNGRLTYRYTDPAGNARNANGVAVRTAYKDAGLDMFPWPHASVADGLERLEGLLTPADGKKRLLIHPRCTNLITAFRNYRRAKIKNQFLDHPADPQHPFEDVMDSLRGGVSARFRNLVLTVHTVPESPNNAWDDDDD